MLHQIARLPFFVLLMAIGASAMLVPSFHGWVLGDFVAMRVFFYGFLLFSFLTVMVGLATLGYDPASVTRSQLFALFAAFAGLPLMLAVPFYEAAGNTTFLNAWFEMVSSLTTTGATVYDNAGRLTPSLHLWRATVGWLGGLLMWIVAVAIFAPMNLGGFEVQAEGGVGGASTRFQHISRAADPSERLSRFAVQLFPIYAGLTFLLWIGLVIMGEVPYVALCHAMAVLSTSGISPINGLYYSVSGFWGELLIFAFFVFAISRITFAPKRYVSRRKTLRDDPELQLAVVLIVCTTLALFLLHFVGSFEAATQTTWTNVFASIWGALFTVTSFLTTTGFESHYWDGAAEWSNLQTPGLFLLGLALIGGGVATTTGGVKLLRIYALFRHSERELGRLLHPSSVAGGGRVARRIRRQGAYISWIFFMLFALSIAAVMLLLSLTGVQFETAMVMSVAALSTTGPLAQLATENPISYAGIPDAAKMVLAAAMVLGRLETLAIIALFNPEVWRQ